MIVFQPQVSQSKYDSVIKINHRIFKILFMHFQDIIHVEIWNSITILSLKNVLKNI